MTNLELAAAAWEAVRNIDDAPWNVLPISIKGKLSDLAGKYRDGAKVAEGDYPPEGFAEKVAELAGGELISTDAPDEIASDVAVGDPIVFLESGREMMPSGLDHAAEHEDTNIPEPEPEVTEDPSPTTEDVASPDKEPPKGKLPADFPSRDLLHAAGINTYGQLFKQRDSDEGLQGVDGIGPALAEKIEERLSE